MDQSMLSTASERRQFANEMVVTLPRGEQTRPIQSDAGSNAVWIGADRKPVLQIFLGNGIRPGNDTGHDEREVGISQCAGSALAGRRVIAQNQTPSYFQSTMPEHVQLALEAKLLSFGGERAGFYGAEPHADLLLEHGRLFEEPVELHLGRRSDCHGNAARLWARKPSRYRIVTGYSLVNNVWCPHSWVLANGVLHETTTVRDKYFGVELDDVDAAGFWADNHLLRRYPDGRIPAKYIGSEPLRLCLECLASCPDLTLIEAGTARVVA